MGTIAVIHADEQRYEAPDEVSLTQRLKELQDDRNVRSIRIYRLTQVFERTIAYTEISLPNAVPRTE